MLTWPVRAAEINNNNNVVTAATGTAVGEIYCNQSNTQKLYDLISGKQGTTYEQIAALASGTPKNAADFRANNNNQALKVTFGGREWYAVYLSQTNETKPRPILTLWLTESIGNCIWGEEHTKMYTSSTVRAYLNNQENQMQNFLIGGTYAGVVVTPKNLSWQASIPNPNAWSYNSGYENYVSGNAVTQDSNYGAWKDDHVWLPSLFETGSTGGETGLWQLSPEQRVDSLTNDGAWHYSYSWLRNAIIDENGYPSTPAIGNHINQGYQHVCSIFRDNMKIRPALHLDLAALNLFSKTGDYDYYALSTTDQVSGAYNYDYGLAWELSAAELGGLAVPSDKIYYLWARNQDGWYAYLDARYINGVLV